MNDKDLSIVIVSYNVKEFILNCINSIYESVGSGISFEIIVVDNGSTDDSVELIEEKFPFVILIKNKSNLTFPKANNQAFDISRGKYIFMLNPDTYIKNDAVRILKEYLDKNHETYFVAPKLLNADLTIQTSIWKFPEIKFIIGQMIYSKYLLKNKLYNDYLYDKPLNVDSFSGAAIMFRRIVIDIIGLLDNNLFWIEDIDYCYRAEIKKLRRTILPNAEIIHFGGQSAKKNYNVSIYNQTFNKIKFYKKYHDLFSTFTVILISFINAIIRAFIFLVLSPLKLEYFKKSIAYFRTFIYFFKLKSY